MIDWKEYKLGDLVEIGRGASPRPIKNYITEKPGIPWVKIADATKSINKYIERTNEYIIKEGRRKTVYPGELIVSNSATPGIPKLMKIEACVHDGWLVFDEYKNIETLYLYYFFLDYRRVLAHSASGTVFKNLTTEIVKNVSVNLPPLPEQKAIAKVLTAFDDKIELLQTQNKTLETMAQTIFKEWFGKYKIGDELPEGWRVGKLGDIANLKSGYAFKSKDFVEESSKKALKIKDLKGDGKVSLNAVSCVSNDVTKLSRVQYFRLKEGDIVLAMSGNTTGKIGVIPPHSNEVYLNQRVGKFFMIKQDLNSFLYSFLMSGNYEEKILSMGYGSAQPNISPSQIENIDIIYPNEEKFVSFLNISNPIFNKVLDNNNQIQSLTETRDTLLPKLMSGQVRVNNLKQTADA
jgi:type I restriction enzyme, S subunit